MTTVSYSLDLTAVEAVLRGRGRATRLPDYPAARTAAVYALFSEQAAGPVVTLIRRSDSVSQHRGEYAFPGGGVEPGDGGLHDTALREVTEELGVRKTDIDPWGELDPQVTVTSGYLVVPFTGRLVNRARFEPAAGEVAEVVHVPVISLIDPANERTITRLAPPQAGHDSPAHSHGTGNAGLELRSYGAFAYNGRVIWGATARILFQVVSILRAAVLHDRPSALVTVP
jgi:8-oxo-dGTP pyrophosphatase MutT (NUDIX family)